MGGAGYVQDYPVEQLYRDNRLNMIHEGTAGIHAKTLLGRKVQGGRAAILFEAMRAAAGEAEATVAAGGERRPEAAACLAECSAALRAAVERAEHVTTALTAAETDRDAALVNAHDYLTLMGHTVIAWHWLRSATAAAAGLARRDATAEQPAAGAEAAAQEDEEDEEVGFYRGKLKVCEFFFRHELPKTEPLANTLLRRDPTVRDMRPGWF